MDEILEDRIRELDNAAGVSDSLSNLEDPLEESSTEAISHQREEEEEEAQEEEQEGGESVAAAVTAEGGEEGVVEGDMANDPEWVDVLGTGQLWKKVLFLLFFFLLFRSFCRFLLHAGGVTERDFCWISGSI